MGYRCAKIKVPFVLGQSPRAIVMAFVCYDVNKKVGKQWARHSQGLSHR